MTELTFHTRRWVRPEELNANETLFGGSLLRWIDEEAGIYAILQLGTFRVVTKFISEINFVATAVQGDLIELGMGVVSFGRTSMTLRAEVRNTFTRASILTIDKMVMVAVDEQGRPFAHGFTEATEHSDRVPLRARNAQEGQRARNAQEEQRARNAQEEQRARQIQG